MCIQVDCDTLKYNVLNTDLYGLVYFLDHAPYCIRQWYDQLASTSFDHAPYNCLLNSCVA